VSAADKAKLLTVMVDADTRAGSGIIFAVNEDRVYIATANHVVRPDNIAATDIKVSFKWLPGEPVKATLLNPHDADALDLAVIVVPDLARTRADKQQLPFDLLAKPIAVIAGTPFWVVGHPEGSLWETSELLHAQKPDAVRIPFLGSVSDGYSGGPLLNRDGLIVGMGRAATQATRMDRIVEQLTSVGWDFSVGLKVANIKYDQLLSGTYSGNIQLLKFGVGYVYLGTNLEFDLKDTWWRLMVGQYEGSPAYRICGELQNECWQPDHIEMENYPLTLSAADGTKPAEPAKKQLFVFERVDEDGQDVRIKSVDTGGYVWFGGISQTVRCCVNKDSSFSDFIKFSVFTVVFP
jgi:hypothetical protein